MDTAEAVAHRISVRSFTNQPVSQHTVRALLTAASRAPSGGNLQPWFVHVLSGNALERLKALMRKTVVESEAEEQREYEIYPDRLWTPLRERRREAGAQRYAALGAADKDASAQRDMVLRNVGFFGAPVGLFFCIDRRVGPPQWADLGMFMQTFMLLAVNEGLDTCPQEVWSLWPQTLRAFLKIDDTRMLFAGMSLGYRESPHPLNGIRTERAPVEEFSSFEGFES
jgi:nitroreductase